MPEVMCAAPPLHDRPVESPFDLVERAKSGEREALDPLDGREPNRGASPLEIAIGREAAEQYEAALGRLKPAEREAVVARIELGFSYEEVADALGEPSAAAARMAVSGALLRLAEELNHRDA